MVSIQDPVLVTGGTGFIGRKLIGQLLEKNLSVVSFALPGEATPEHWGNKVTVIRGDITNKGEVAEAMRNIKTVFHLAAVVGMGAYDQHRAITVEGSRNIFEPALEHNVKVILAASIVVYGDQIQTMECHEELPHGKHQGPYSWAKMAQEKLAVEFQGQGMKLSVIRPANVYGVGSGPWVEGLFNMMAMGALPVIDGGHGNAGLVHVNNLVQAFMLAAERDEAIGQIYTACDGLDVTWAQYFHDLAAMKGINELPEAKLQDLIDAATPYDNPEGLEIAANVPTLPFEFINLIGYSNRFNADRLRDELGWEPKTSYQEALKEIQDGLNQGAS